MKSAPDARIPLASRPVLNALSVLEALTDGDRPQSLSHLSRISKVPKASALRYLAAFQQAGYAHRDPVHGTYSLGAKVVALARRFYGEDGMLSAARNQLAALALATGETAHLAVMRVPEVVYVDIADSPQRIRAIVPRGDRLPAYCVASGRAILAYSDSDTVEAIIKAGLVRRTKLTIVDRNEFLAELKRTTKRGFATNIGEWVEDVVGVSAPLFSSEGKVFAAMGVSSPMARVDRKRIAKLGEIVKSFAARLSASLAGAPLGTDGKDAKT
jgi:DNA-binding IclR family transcriptional regulator